MLRNSTAKVELLKEETAMQTLFRGKHFITLRDWTRTENHPRTAKAVMLLTMGGRGR